jgi:hypothetical protein
MFVSASVFAEAQMTTPAAGTPQVPKAATGAGSGDPLAVGKGAMHHGDYESAHKFFSEYLRDNPDDSEAVFYLGGSELGLKNFSAAAADFQRVIAQMPNQWSAHSNLALAYAQSGDWAAFDKERAVIKAARDANSPGVDKDGFDLIDIVTFGDKMYQVRYFYKLHGQYNTRYVFLHFGADGRADNYFQCESDDADQGMFAAEHKEQAKAGERRFSLDTYTAGPNGMSQGLIKFYDGEPTYETVRTDVLKSLKMAADSKKNAAPKK